MAATTKLDTLRILRALAIFICFFSPGYVAAQSASDYEQPKVARSSPSKSGFSEFAIYTGQSLGYPLVMSSLATQRLTLVGVSYSWHFRSNSHIDVNWSADLKPLALHSRDVGNSRQYTYGGGGAFGVQFTLRKLPGQPFFAADGGLLGFTKDTPIPGARRLNITLDFGLGFYVPVASHRALKTGFSFFHFSNADTARRNPSFDGFMVYAAYTFRKTST